MNRFDYNLQMGTPVHCHNGECGKLSKVAVDTSFLEVTHLIVEEGLLLKRARVFPIGLLKRIERNELYLDFDEKEISNFPEYVETVTERPVVGAYSGSMDVLDEARIVGVPGEYGMHAINEKVRMGVPDDLIVVGHSTPIRNTSGSVGKLDSVIVGSEHFEILAIVARHGLIFPEAITISIDWIQSIAENDIVLKYTNEELKNLLASPATAIIEGEAQPAFELNNSSSLITDLERELRRDPRTCDAVIDVVNDRGIVTLVGNVNNPTVRQAAEEIAAAHPGVVTVVNSLRPEAV